MRNKITFLFLIIGTEATSNIENETSFQAEPPRASLSSLWRLFCYGHLTARICGERPYAANWISLRASPWLF